MDPSIQLKQELGGWSAKFSKETRKQRHPLPRFIGEPAIDYDALKQLCGVEGLGERDRPSTSDAHVSFMSNYVKMFSSLKPHQQETTSLRLQKQTLRKLTFVEGEIRKPQQNKIPHDKGLLPHWCQGFNPPLSHNISDHVSKLHRQSAVTRSPAGLQNMRLKAVRRILKKLPFERKSRENEMLFRHIQYFQTLTEQVPSRVLLKELCSVAQLDKCPEEDYTVFGGTGLHLILRGSVLLQTSSAILPVSEKTRTSFSSATPTTEEGAMEAGEKLIVGQCFGTLRQVEGKERNSRFLSVTTLEPCEFLKISTNDYARVIQIIDAREEDEKLSLVKTCKLFHNWPLLSLKKIAGLIKWREFAPGQVLVSEGERCEVIGFIKKGHCFLRRCITVAHTFPNGKKEKRTKSVMIGKIVPGDSFGETTVLKGLPVRCSVITATRVEMGTISSLDVYDLDVVTRSLLSQSYSVMDVSLTEEEIQKEYIEQEKAKEWMRVKNKVVSDVIYYRGILPGYSKWSRNPSSLPTSEALHEYN